MNAFFHGLDIGTDENFLQYHRLFYKYIREHKGELQQFKGFSRWFARARLYAAARDYAERQTKKWRRDLRCLY